MKILIVAVNGLANRLRAISSGFDLARQFPRFSLQIAWPIEPGVCEVEVEDLFSPEFIREFIVRPETELQSALACSIPEGLSYLPEAQTWVLAGGWLGEQVLLRSFIRRTLGDGRQGVIVSGGEFGLAGGRFSSRKARGQQYSGIKFKDELMAIQPPQNPLTGLPPDLGIHLRTSDFPSQFPSFPSLIRTIEAHLLLRCDTTFFLAGDSVSSLNHWKSQLVDAGFSVVENSMTGLNRTLNDFFSLSQCPIVFSPFWSTFAEGAFRVHGERSSKLVPLGRKLASTRYLAANGARFLRSAIIPGRRAHWRFSTWSTGGQS